jgi:uncharacterized protein (DUF302 family)
MPEIKNMTVRKMEVERFSLTSSKPFEAVVAALEPAVRKPDMVECRQTTASARDFGELKWAVEAGLGRTGLLMFMKLDHRAILRKEALGDRPRIIRFVIGNRLTMKEMVEHVSEAASYAPVTILVDERPDGVPLSSDRMISFLAPYGNTAALTFARDLDSKIESLIRECAIDL